MTLQNISDREFAATDSDTGAAGSSLFPERKVAPLDLRRGKTSWQDDIVNTLCRYLELEKGWDSYSGLPLRYDTGMFTLHLLNDIMGPTIPLPHIVPVADGGVQVEWHQNSLDIELYVAKPYDCELTVVDHVSNTTSTTALTGDFKPLSDAISKLVDYNRHLRPIADAS